MADNGLSDTRTLQDGCGSHVDHSRYVQSNNKKAHEVHGFEMVETQVFAWEPEKVSASRAQRTKVQSERRGRPPITCLERLKTCLASRPRSSCREVTLQCSTYEIVSCYPWVLVLLSLELAAIAFR
jgi:hypothetical protein